MDLEYIYVYILLVYTDEEDQKVYAQHYFSSWFGGGCKIKYITARLPVELYIGRGCSLVALRLVSHVHM